MTGWKGNHRLARTQEAEELGPTFPWERGRQEEGRSPRWAVLLIQSVCAEPPGWEEGHLDVE